MHKRVGEIEPGEVAVPEIGTDLVQRLRRAGVAPGLIREVEVLEGELASRRAVQRDRVRKWREKRKGA